MKKFPERLRELRKEKGLTIIELAKALDIARSALCYWEAGERLPSFDNAAKIAVFFGVTLDYLAGLED